LVVPTARKGDVLTQPNQRAVAGSTDPRMRHIRGTRLSRERERELVVAADGGDEAASWQLVESFLPAIGGVARRFESRGPVQRIELLQEGVAGLLFAVKRYDPRTETPFWAYASFWVRKAMQDLVAELTRPVALSDHAVRGLVQLKAARRAHLQAHRTEPTSTDLAAATGFTRTQVESLLATDRPARSFEEPLGVEQGTTATFGDTVADPGAEDEYGRVLDAMEIRTVRRLADRLEDRERTVLWAHYGLGQRAHTLSEIGSALGLTAERARQIEKDALKKLREAAAQPPDFSEPGRLRSQHPRLPHNGRNER
jgi:RNA polymerase primary sigma factor